MCVRNVKKKVAQGIREMLCTAGCLMLLIPAISFAQTAGDAGNRAIIKIEESTHEFTPENQETKQIIISKIFDSGDSLGNSYLIRVNGTGKAIVIDPGYNYEAIAKYLKQINVDLEAILLTNGFFLRIAGNEELRKHWPDATILIGEKDAGMLTDPKANMSNEFGGVTSPIANVWLNDGDAFEIAGIPLSVIGTPGHTPGSMTFVLALDENIVAFTGDFIYKDGISSASLPSSNEEALQRSLDRFLEMQFSGTLVFPGHGENTTVAAFYQQMTGRSISVIDSPEAVADNSPVIIIERDPATTVLTETVFVPTIEYRTETIVIDRFVRPWVSVGVTIPFWNSWYRPWYGYHHHHPLPPFRPPHVRPPHWSGGYPPPLVVPQRPGRPDLRPDRPDGNRPSIRPPQPGGPVIRPPRPDQNRPGDANRPGPNRPGDTNRPETRPTPGIIPGIRPGTRPTPGVIGGNRPVPGTRPNDGAVPGTRPSDRPIPGTRPANRPTTQTRPESSIRPETRPAISTRPAPATRPETRPTTSTRPTAPTTSTRPAISTRPAPTTRPETRPTTSTRPTAPTTSTRPAISPRSDSSQRGGRITATPSGGGRSGAPARGNSGGGRRGSTTTEQTND